MTTKEKMNPNKTARIAASLSLIMIPFALFGIMWVSSLIVPGDAAITVNNIIASESLFRLSIGSSLLIQIGHILLVLILYKLLKAVNKNHALLMVIFLLVGAPIAMLNELNRFAVLLLLNGADYLTAFTADQLPAQVMLFLDLHEYGVFISTIFWGLWLFPFGYLVFKSGYIPRILGVLLIIAGLGYLIDFVAFFLFPNFPSIGQFMTWAELVWPFWLLIKGVNVEQWEKRALEAA
jgi:hypothetical protein